MTPCREWQGARNGWGYGHRTINQRQVKIHRQVVEWIGEDQFGTPYSNGLVVMHLCDRPACFRYDHLKLGTNKQNSEDMVSKGRQNKGAKNGSAKLSQTDVDEIRRRAAEGEYHHLIAADFPVSRTVVTRIANGVLWQK